ncbi:MAG: hypothetical protein HQ548_06355 [Chloroflexi bacterium]|nr:hypothetical protein [Chloroflexota bacterium]
MAKKPESKEVETVLRRCLVDEGYKLNNPLGRGETGADIIARRRKEAIYIEVIGFDTRPPRRSKDFYESFFRAVSRLNGGTTSVVIALPARFGRGLRQRARQYRVAWARIGKAFPELAIWLIDTESQEYERHTWAEWQDP